MTYEEQVKFIDDFTIRMKELLLSKGRDYANEDKLSNFKNVATSTNQLPEKVVLTLMGVKLARLSNLIIQGAPANHESIDDTLIDMANYAALMSMILCEKQVSNIPSK
jgi:hypothetical protein